MKQKSMLFGIVILLLMPLLAFGAKKSDELKSTLFSEVKITIENAKIQRANLLSPNNFEEGYKAYIQASNDFDSDGNLETIKQNISKSLTYIQKAMKNIELSSLTLANLLTARDAALSAQAAQYALKEFNRAEDTFRDAARYVEEGDVAKARKISEKAEPQYKKAQELAVKEGLLGDVKSLRKTIDKGDIEDYSPELVEKADEAFKKAEKMADSGKYDEAKVKVEEAKYLYGHAMALSPEIKNAKKSKKSLEDIYRDFEKRLTTISSRLGLAENYDKGIDYQLKSITATVDGIKKDREELKGELSIAISANETRSTQLNSQIIVKDKEIATLKEKTAAESEKAVLEAERAALLSQKLKKENSENESRKAQLNSQIVEKEKELAKLKEKTAAESEKASLEAEKTALLSQKLEKENIEKEKQSKIRKIFDSNEGLVLKDGSDIVIRLPGLTFPSGKSIIEVDNFNLLAKVQKAIREYPNAKIVIEGHTDSIGDANFNQILSEERAKAVKQYLVANNTVPEDKVTALGFGDSNPVAPNKSKDGRAKNRRIDVVIKTEK